MDFEILEIKISTEDANKLAELGEATMLNYGGTENYLMNIGNRSYVLRDSDKEVPYYELLPQSKKEAEAIIQ